MSLVFSRYTIETARHIALQLQRDSGTFTFTDQRFMAWADDGSGNPDGAAVYDTDSLDAATDGTATWDQDSQTLTWTLPTGGLGTTARNLVGAFMCTAADGVRVFPMSTPGNAQYIKIKIVVVGTGAAP